MKHPELFKSSSNGPPPQGDYYKCFEWCEEKNWKFFSSHHSKHLSTFYGFEIFKEANNFACQLAGSRGAGSDCHTLLAREPLDFELREIFDAHSWHAGQFLRNLHQAIGVIAARVADDDSQVRAPRLGYYGLLAALRGRANVNMHFHVRIFLPHILDHAPGVPLRERCLRRKCQVRLLVRRELQFVDIGLSLDQANMAVYLAQHTFWLRVPLFANVENVVALLHQ